MRISPILGFPGRNINELARQWLAKVEKAFQDFAKERPEVVSLMIYGSLGRGEPGPLSDLDIYVFVDAERLQQGKIRSVTMTNHVVPDQLGPATYLKSRELDTAYVEDLWSTLEVEFPEMADHTGRGFDISVFPISQEIIDKMLRRLRSKEDTPGDPNKASPNLALMFHFAVGEKINVYRKYFLDKLRELGMAGDVLWRRVVAAMQDMERFPKKVHYPKTVAEAYVFYHLET